jgi:phosphopantothenoylcysteine decarboxylase/phosphopantothenate--cysteine ligase
MHPSLRDKEIVLGVTGSIAAYKACEVASRLREAGARVLPVLTAGGAQFVGAASLEGITGQAAITSMFAPAQTSFSLRPPRRTSSPSTRTAWRTTG